MRQEESGVAGEDLDWLRAALGTDADAWDAEFGVTTDESQLGIERNLLRYLPVPVTIRVAEDATLTHTVRAIAAALAAESASTRIHPACAPTAHR